MREYILAFVLSVTLCLMAEFAGWHIRDTPRDFWKHAVRGPLCFAIAWLILRAAGIVKGA